METIPEEKEEEVVVRSVEEEQVEPCADELCTKRARMDTSEMKEDDEQGVTDGEAKSCRVCFSGPDEQDAIPSKVIHYCAWTEKHWVHASCHAQLMRNNQHRACAGCRVPTKLVAFETSTIRCPKNLDQICRSYLELSSYVPLSQFSNNLFETLCRDAENRMAITRTILPYEGVSLSSVGDGDVNETKERKYRNQVEFARNFATSSITEKIFKSEDTDLIVGFLRRYYYLLLSVEINDFAVCENRIMHHVLCLKSFEVMRPVVECLRHELGHDVTNTSVLEHVATGPDAPDDWATVQRVYDLLGGKFHMRLTVLDTVKRWSLKPAILRHLLSKSYVPRITPYVWDAYLTNRVRPFKGYEEETWRVLVDLARPEGWLAGSWDKPTVPEAVWAEHRPEYCIPGYSGAIVTYPISKPREARLYHWDVPWTDCSVIFCHERGLPADEMDQVIECACIYVIRDPAQGLVVWGTDDKDAGAFTATTKVDIDKHLEDMSPQPRELLRLTVNETRRARIKYHSMQIFQLDSRGTVLRYKP